MAEQAAEEQPRQEHRRAAAAGRTGSRRRRAASPWRRATPAARDQSHSRPVPALALEGDDEAREVERERREPQQRHRGDVLRQVVGHREQQHRAGGGQREPQQTYGRFFGRCVASAVARLHRLPAASARPSRRKARANAREQPRPGAHLLARRRGRARRRRDSRPARPARRGWTPRTGGTGSRPAARARTTPAAAGWSTRAGSTAGRRTRRAAAGCGSPAPRRPPASRLRPARSAGSRPRPTSSTRMDARPRAACSRASSSQCA